MPGQGAGGAGADRGIETISRPHAWGASPSCPGNLIAPKLLELFAAFNILTRKLFDATKFLCFCLGGFELGLRPLLDRASVDWCPYRRRTHRRRRRHIGGGVR